MYCSAGHTEPHKDNEWLIYFFLCIYPTFCSHTSFLAKAELLIAQCPKWLKPFLSQNAAVWENSWMCKTSDIQGPKLSKANVPKSEKSEGKNEGQNNVVKLSSLENKNLLLCYFFCSFLFWPAFIDASVAEIHFLHININQIFFSLNTLEKKGEVHVKVDIWKWKPYILRWKWYAIKRCIVFFMPFFSWLSMNNARHVQNLLN